MNLKTTASISFISSTPKLMNRKLLTMSRQWTKLMAVVVRRIPISRPQLDTTSLLLARNCIFSRCSRQTVRISVLGDRNFATSSQQTEVDTNSTGETHKEQNTESSTEGYVCCLRGLPRYINEEMIVKFLGDSVNILGGTDGVHFVFKRGMKPPLLQAYVELASESDLQKACKLDRPYMGKKFIDVCNSSMGEMTRELSQWKLTVSQDGEFIRLDGLPFEYTQEDVKTFFKDMNINIDSDDILPVIRTGICFVKLSSKDLVDKALKLNDPPRYIGRRYVEMRHATAIEAEVVKAAKHSSVTERRRMFDMYQNPRRSSDSWRSQRGEVNRQPSTGESSEHTVYMRGLPFWVDEARIYDFFSPLEASSVRLVENQQGRCTGEAYVSFTSSSSVDEALKKDRQYIGQRYVEIFRKNEGW